jgi:hypothetical protein
MKAFPTRSNDIDLDQWRASHAASSGTDDRHDHGLRTVATCFLPVASEKSGKVAQIDREGAIFKERLQTAEACEAFTAFAERRPPNSSSAAG